MKTKISYSLFVITFLISCVTTPALEETNISHSQALQLITQNAGTKLPERKLYHTYEETRALKRYWVDKKGYSSGHESSQTTYTLTLTKIEGNYIEGQMSYTGSAVGSFPVFGRYNFTSIYLFNSNAGAKFPALWEYQIGQNGRTLKRIRVVDRNINGVLDTWEHEPEYGVVNKTYSQNGKEYRANETNSTLFIAKTDDYLEEEKSNTRKALTEKETSNKQKSPEKPTSSSSLTDKLKELKDLHDNGIITKTEYDNMRKQVLKDN